MLKKGYTIKEIIEIVGLPETEILDIEKKLINN